MRAEQIGQQRFSSENVRELERVFPSLVLGINAELCVTSSKCGHRSDARRQRHVLDESGWPSSTIDAAVSQAAEPALAELRRRIELLKTKIEKNHQASATVTLAEAKTIVDGLRGLEELLGTESPTLRDLYESFAEAANRAMVAYTTVTHDYERGLDLLGLAEAHARSREQKNLIEKRNYPLYKP